MFSIEKLFERMMLLEIDYHTLSMIQIIRVIIKYFELITYHEINFLKQNIIIDLLVTKNFEHMMLPEINYRKHILDQISLLFLIPLIINISEHMMLPTINYHKQFILANKVLFPIFLPLKYFEHMMVLVTNYHI